MGESAANSDTSVQSDDVLEGAPDASMEEQAQQGGYQSEKKLFDMPESLPTVTVDRITGALEDVKAKVRLYLAPFKKAGNNIYFNKSAGLNIRFSGNGIKHTLIRSASPDLANSLMAMPELLESSVYLGKDKNRKKARGVKFYHNFAGKVSIDGDVKIVLITARKVSDGKIFYDQAIIKQSPDVSASGGELLEAGSHLPARGAGLSKEIINETQVKSKEDEQIQAPDDGALSLAENNFIATAKQKIRDLVTKVKADKTHQEKVDLFPVTQQEIAEAAENGLDIANYAHMIDSSAVNHINKKHGNTKTEQARGQIAITEQDYETIADVITAPDQKVFGGKTRLGRDEIFYIKKMADGTTVVLEEKRDKRMRLALTSMRKYPPTVHATSIVKSLNLNAQDGFGGNANSIEENQAKRKEDEQI